MWYNRGAMDKVLTSDQEKAKNLIAEWFLNTDDRMFVLSGYAGTGKTFLIDYVVREVLHLEPGTEAVFVTPTGKAATVLIRAGTVAGTVHSLIYRRDEDDFDVDENGEIVGNGRLTFVKRDKIDEKIRLIVIDEASMIAEDYGRGRNLPPVRITGIDISGKAIEKASRATYQPAHVEKVPPRWLSSYFTHNDGNYTVTGPVRRRVTFAQANLNDPDALRRRYDLIMCRNVIIYFDRETREKVLDNLHRHLAVSGYLILGHSEIIRSRAKFVYQKDSVYQKQPEAIIS